MANGKDSTIEDIWDGISVEDVTTKAIKDSFIYLNKTRTNLPCKEIQTEVQALRVDVNKIKNDGHWISGITGAVGAAVFVVAQWLMNKFKGE